jgi:UDP-GlcNAc:undecaprenyl-phosphate GlcNAc-1-phosphate transferase
MIVPFIVAIFTTPLIGKLADILDIKNDTKRISNNRLNKYENNKRRIKSVRIPLLGGLAVLIPLIIVYPFIFGLNAVSLPLYIAIILLTVMGIIDDAFNLPGIAQFTGQFAAAAIVALSVVNLTVIKIPFDGFLDLSETIYQTSLYSLPIEFAMPGDLILIFWIVVCINAIKWVSGLDALMEVNLVIAYFMLYIIGLRTGSIFVVVMSAMLSGGIAGFTMYNFPPARIMSASTGKTVYGFIIAVLAILNNTKMAVTILIILLPLLDFIFVIIKRLMHHKPRNILEVFKTPLTLLRTSDTNHIHHQLLKLHFSNKQILLIETGITFLLGSLAVLTTEAYRLFLILFGGLVLLGLLIAINLLARDRKVPQITEDGKTKIQDKNSPAYEKEESPESRYSY